MILEASAVEKWYFRGKDERNRFYAVKKSDLVLMPGTVTVLTGRSGSGKTTFLNIVAGLLKPDSGHVRLDGEDLYALDDRSLSGTRNRHIGLIPQGADVLPSLTCTENILLPQEIGRSGNTAGENERISGTEERAGKLMEKLGVLPLASVRASELSGGEKRLICVVRALAGKPDILLADEPTSDLDDDNMRIVLRMLRDSADEGASVLIVSHDSESLQFADIKLRMDDGILYRL